MKIIYSFLAMSVQHAEVPARKRGEKTLDVYYFFMAIYRPFVPLSTKPQDQSR